MCENVFDISQSLSFVQRSFSVLNEFVDIDDSCLSFGVILVESEAFVEVFDSVLDAFLSEGLLFVVNSTFSFLVSNKTELEVSLGIFVVKFMGSPEVKFSLINVAFVILSTG